MGKNTLNQTSSEHRSPPVIPPAGVPRFSPLGCSAGLRLLVAAGVSLLLWLSMFWAMRS